MKKKLIGLVAGTLIGSLLFGMTAMAATSVSTTNANVDSNTMAAYAEAIAPTVEGATSDKGIIAKKETVERYDNAVLSVAATVPTEAGKTASVAAVFDLTQFGFTEAEVSAGLKVTFRVPNFAANKSYAIMHFTNGAWENIPATINADGTISGVFYSFSPVAIVEIAPTQGATSPKTADASAVPYVLAVLAFGACAFVAFRRARA